MTLKLLNFGWEGGGGTYTFWYIQLFGSCLSVKQLSNIVLCYLYNIMFTYNEGERTGDSGPSSSEDTVALPAS